MSPMAEQLVRLLTSLADLYEADGVRNAGALRQAAQIVPQIDHGRQHDHGCPRCGGPMPDYAGAGRPRRWCSDICRKSTK